MSAERLQPLQIELKEATRELHDLAEHGAFNKKLVMGQLPLSAYIDSLGQLYLIHRALEAQIRRVRLSVPALDSMIKDYQFQEPYLLADLAYFGRDVESVTPLAVTARFVDYIDDLANRRPIALLGIHYVFEGSNNGSKYIANALRRAYRLEGVSGLKYFDPYGDQQREYWQIFKDAMACIELAPADRSAVTKAACETFRAVIALHASLYENLIGTCCPG